MRLHRFYLEKPITEKTFVIEDKDLVHQWKKVFRYNVGSQVIIFDGSGFDFRCLITSIRNLGATLEVLEKTEVRKPEKSIWLCQAIIKKDNFETVVEKVVQIGAEKIIPIISERSEKKKVNHQRLLKIIKEASEQSGRADLASLSDEIELLDLLESGILPQEKIFFDPNRPPIKEYLKSQSSQRSFALFIGPEGGWSDREMELFAKYNIYGFSFGPQILRAETASTVACGLFLCQ
jgi:16S rRNA (uracil1498-N3)-methyltransferase